MSITNSMPLFSSAPRIALSIDGSVIGYAIGLNFNLSVDVQEVYAMGSYGPIALEPTYYNLVTGTMQIIRLSRPAARTAILGAANENKLTSTTSHKAIDWSGSDGQKAESQDSLWTETVTPAGKRNLYAHLDPDLVLVSTLFDMQMTLRHVAGTDAFQNLVGIKGDDAATLTVDESAVTQASTFLRFKGCRLTGRNTNITMGQIVNEPINFSAIYVEPEDCGFSSDSGVKDS